MRHFISVVVLLAGCLYAGAATAAVDVFLKLDGIAGESMDDRHKNEVDVITFNHELGMGVQANAPAKPLAAGRPALAPAAPAARVVGPITITKYVDAASPLFMARFASGEKIATAVLTVRKAGGQPIEFLKANLQGLAVIGYEMSQGVGQPRPTETVTLSFESIDWQYVKQSADGSAGATTSASYAGK